MALNGEAVVLFLIFYLAYICIQADYLARRKQDVNKSRVRSEDSGVMCSPFVNTTGNESSFEIELDGRKYPQVVPMHFNASLNFECLNRGPIKRIFYWTRFWWAPSFDFGVGSRTPFELHNCPVTNCYKKNYVKKCMST